MKLTVRHLGVAVLLAMVGGALPASADNPSAGGPKPLLADPAASQKADAKSKDQDKDKIGPDGLTKELSELRQKMKDEYNAWRIQNEQVEAECAAAKNPRERAMCDRKRQDSQARLDTVHAHTRDMARRIDTWRREQAGLPPATWWDDGKPQKASRPSGAANNGGSAQPAQPSPVLLPQSPTLPSGTF